MEKTVELHESKKLLPDVSNKRLLSSLRGQVNGDVVIKVAPGSMELLRLEKLKKLLLENPYTDHVKMPDSGLYRWDDLKRLLQATDEELESDLTVLSAVEINGYWRIVDDMYMCRILTSIIWSSIMKCWCLSSLDIIEAVESLAGFPQVIVHHCFQLYGRITYGGGWEMDKKRVSLHVARQILAANGKMKLGAFMEEWVRSVPGGPPGGLPVSLDILEGEVLVEQSWVSLPSDRFPGYFKDGPNGIGRIYTLTTVFHEMHQKKKNSAYCSCCAT
ncbi:hypothetical protein M8C21_015095 [Ambrosia artemisiifolia]|uniref:Sister chromatid cohesion protein DCC1 n=1 Tax=Ambrosia artemisiifolia TaxID=4212 RepID=A0AAD5G6G0_AMBAR|nr:hypothetical protein M8C21_015095 [Ambrosia artemisiifolia]